jgi:hypothetical protein
LVNIAYMIGSVATGYFALPIWTPAWLAIVGIAAYLFDRPQARQHSAEMLGAREYKGLTMFFGGLYVMYLLLASVLYGLGSAIGYFL